MLGHTYSFARYLLLLDCKGRDVSGLNLRQTALTPSWRCIHLPKSCVVSTSTNSRTQALSTLGEESPRQTLSGTGHRGQTYHKSKTDASTRPVLCDLTFLHLESGDCLLPLGAGNPRVRPRSASERTSRRNVAKSRYSPRRSCTPS